MAGARRKASEAVGNTIATDQLLGYAYQYPVVPEYSSSLTVVLLTFVSIGVITASRRKHPSG